MRLLSQSPYTFTAADIATAQRAVIPSGVNICRTQSYSTPNYGVGSAVYERVSSRPSHALKFRSVDRYLPNGTRDDSQGGWWEIAETVITPEMAGANEVDDTTAVLNAGIAASISGRIFSGYGKTYKLSSSVQFRLPIVMRDASFLRIGQTSGNVMLYLTGTEVDIENINTDGNRAIVSVGCNNIVISPACTKVRVVRCECKGAKMADGYGAGLVLAGAGSNSRNYVVEDNDLHDNDSHGFSASNAYHLTVRRNRSYSNGGHGVFINTFDLKLNENFFDVEISGNIVYKNSRSGVVLGNFLQDNVQNGFNYGISNIDVDTSIVKNNICYSNAEYGVALYGIRINCLYNVCNSNHDGIQFTVAYGMCSDNNCRSNTTFGIDAGFSVDAVVSDNICQGNQTGINGAGQRVTINNNILTLNSVSGINLSGADSDAAGRTWGVAFARAVIRGNNISYVGVSDYGIRIHENFPLALVESNTFIPGSATEGAAQRALVVISDSAIIKNNTLMSTFDKTIATDSNGNVVVPDVLDHIQLNSATAVRSLRYYSQSLVGTGIAWCTVTAGGSGYAAATTTVTITGDGTGATATAAVNETTGTVMGISMISYGTGYTTATVTIGSSGSGTGAMAMAQKGLPLLNERTLDILFLRVQTVTRAASPLVENESSSDTVAAAKQMIHFRSLNQQWYTDV